MKLQIAIDSVFEGVLEFAKSVEKFTDIIEIGTPLVYKHGISFTQKVRRDISKAKLLVDAKIVDAGSLESRLFLERGVDIVTLLGGANNRTIQKARSNAKDFQSELMIDLIDISERDQVSRIKKLHHLGCNYFCLHRPSDAKENEELYLPNSLKLQSNLKLAVSGGINLDNIGRVMEYRPDIIIVGSAITEHPEPIEQAMKFRELLNT